MNSLSRIFRLSSIFDRKLELLKFAEEAEAEIFSEPELTEDQKTLLSNSQTRVFNIVFEMHKYLKKQLSGKTPFLDLLTVPPNEPDEPEEPGKVSEFRFVSEATNAQATAKDVVGLINSLNSTLKEYASKKDSEDHVASVNINNIYNDYISVILQKINDLKNTSVPWVQQQRDEYGDVYGFILNRETSHGFLGDPTAINQIKRENIIVKCRRIIEVFNRIIGFCNKIKEILVRVSREKLVPESVREALVSDPTVRAVEVPHRDVLPSEVRLMQQAGLLMRPELYNSLPTEYHTSDKLLETILYNDVEKDSRSEFPGMSATQLAREIKNALLRNSKVLSAGVYLNSIIKIVGEEFRGIITKGFGLLTDGEKIFCLSGGHKLPLSEADKYKIPKPSRISADNAIDAFRGLILAKIKDELSNDPVTSSLLDKLVSELRTKESVVGDKIKNLIDSIPAGMEGKYSSELTEAKIAELKRRMEVIVPKVLEFYKKNEEKARPLDAPAPLPFSKKIKPKFKDREPRQILEEELKNSPRLLGFLDTKRLSSAIIRAFNTKLSNISGNEDLIIEFKEKFAEKLDGLDEDLIQEWVNLSPEELEAHILTKLDLN